MALDTSPQASSERQSPQVADTVLMVEPVRFTNNPYTRDDNVHQAGLSEGSMSQEWCFNLRLAHQQKALAEFAGVRKLLLDSGIDVVTLKDTLYPDTPDSIFPNNWVSFHTEYEGTMALYPMKAPNRRQERRPDEVAALLHEHGFQIRTVADGLVDAENGDPGRFIAPQFLEGTGSMVLDRKNRVAYASLSRRTSPDLFRQWAEMMGYTPVEFQAWEKQPDKRGERKPVYHANVVMSIGERVAVLADEAIEPQDRARVRRNLESRDRDVIEITADQMDEYAGNVLQLRGKGGALYTVMSSRAHAALRQDQLDRLLAHGQVIHAPIPTIEDQGGGSVRCMLAEVFLPKRSDWKFQG